MGASRKPLGDLSGVWEVIEARVSDFLFWNDDDDDSILDDDDDGAAAAIGVL